MTALLCPLFQDPQVTDNNEFLAGGLLWFYEAGTSTLTNAFTTEAGDVAWSNPIVLNSRGESGGTIWLASGQSYRIVLEGKPFYGQEHGRTITDHDDITGVPLSVEAEEWIPFAGAPTYISSTSFTVVGDYRDIFSSSRKLRIISSSGVGISSVTSSTFGANTTTINVTGPIDAGIYAVEYSFLTLSATPDRFDSLVAVNLNIANDAMINNNLTVVGNTDLQDDVTVGGNVYADGNVLVFETQAVWSNLNNTFDTSSNTSGFVYFENGLRLYRGYEIQDFVSTGTTQQLSFVYLFSSPFPTRCFQVMTQFGEFTPSTLAAYSPIISVQSIDVDRFQYNVICRSAVPAGTYNFTFDIFGMGH